MLVKAQKCIFVFFVSPPSFQPFYGVFARGSPPKYNLLNNMCARPKGRVDGFNHRCVLAWVVFILWIIAVFLVLIELNELPSFVSSLVFFICSHPRENVSCTFHCFCNSFSVTELREDFSPRPVRLLGAGDSLRGRSNVVGDAFSTSALPSL